MTVKAAVLVQPRRLELRERKVPRPGCGEVLVRVRAALTCGADLCLFRRGGPALPLPLGHEMSGDVAATGPGVKGFREGDAVMVAPWVGCGDCSPCRRGREDLCEEPYDGSHLGAFSPYALVGEPVVRQTMFLKPRDLSYAEAALLDPFSRALHAVSAAPLRREDTVVILGDGAVGLLCLTLIRARGAGKVLVVGRYAERLQMARELGADGVVAAADPSLRALVQEETEGMGAELAIVCCRDARAPNLAVDLVSRGGTVLLFGGCPVGSSATFDTTRLHYDQITLLGVRHFSSRTVRAAYRMLCRGHLEPGRLITHRCGLKQVPEAFRRLDRGEGIKYAVEPEEE